VLLDFKHGAVNWSKIDYATGKNPLLPTVQQHICWHLY